MRTTAITHCRGFNLVETLVASVILSASVLTLGAIGTRALTETRLNRHYEAAASLLNRQLALIDYMGIDYFVDLGETEGAFERPAPGYAWRMSTEYQGTDNLYLVSLTITWVERKRPKSLTVQTMLNGQSLLAGDEGLVQEDRGQEPQQ